MNTDTRKAAILSALRKFIAQRPGMDPRNYDRGGYLRESREVTRDRHDAETLLRRIELSDSITADAILAEASGGGRLTIEEIAQAQCANCEWRGHPSQLKGIRDYHERVAPGEIAPAGECPACRCLAHICRAVKIDYCTGQYFPTEYRKAAARLMASVLWTWVREQCMPEPRWYVRAIVDSEGDKAKPLPGAFTSRVGAERELERIGGSTKGIVVQRYAEHSAGDWLRAHFRREFGKHLAERYFS